MMFSKRVHLVLDVEDGGATIRFNDTCGKSFEHYEGSWRSLSVTVARSFATSWRRSHRSMSPSFCWSA